MHSKKKTKKFYRIFFSCLLKNFARGEIKKETSVFSQTKQINDLS